MPKQEDLQPGTLAPVVTAAYHIKALRDTGELLFYDNGVYRDSGRVRIEEMVKKLVGVKASTHMTREVIHHVRSMSYVDRNRFDSDPYKISIINGILDLRESRLYPHDPDFLTTAQLPVRFEPNAECPKFREFLSQVVSGADVPVLEEFIGYCLFRRYPFHRWLLLVGEGANGKGTFLRVLERFLGSENCTHRSMQDIAGNRFAGSSLYGKLANIMPDLPGSAITDTGRLKTLTGEDTVSAEKKGQDAFDFTNYAKIIFSTNRPPRIADEEKTYAFWRRVVYIRFPNTFEGKDRDPFLFDDLTSESELSGILNLALTGLSRLLERGDFNYNQTPANVEAVYNRAADPIQSFVDDRCRLGAEWTSTDDLFKAYSDYAEWENLPQRTRNVFARELKRVCGNRIHQARQGGQDNRESGYWGIAVQRPQFSAMSLNPATFTDEEVKVK